MNNAFDQQVITRLNERIKEQKRNMKKIDTPCSRFAKKIYKVTKFTKLVALGWLLLVPFFTKPRWCIEKFKDTPQYDTCGFNIDFFTKKRSGEDRTDCDNILIERGDKDKLKIKCDSGNDHEHVGYPSSYAPKLPPKK